MAGDFRRALVHGAALCAVFCGAAYAQAPAEEEIVVTGIRASLRNSMEVKRDAPNVVDVISAEDIGDFPDKNVSEALQRVTGVQIFRQDGEGRGISIRGTDPGLTRIEINGSSALPLTVAGTDRTVDFRDIPVEFIQRLEVVKSPTADMTEGGIGGTVRVITRRPFDSPDGFLAGSAQAIYSDIAETWDPKASLIGSRLFFNNTLGVLLSASVENRHLYSNNARTTGWIRRPTVTVCDQPLVGSPAQCPTPQNVQNPGTAALIPVPNTSSDLGFPGGDGVQEWIPEIPRLIIDRRETERMAFSGIVEWRPNDSFKLYLDGTYATAEEVVSSSLMQLSGNTGFIDYEATTEGEDHTVDHYEFTSGTFTNPGTGPNVTRVIDLAFRNILGGLTRTQYTTTLGGEWNLGDLTIEGRLDYSNADVQNDEINSTATMFGLPHVVVDYTGSQHAPNFSFPGIDVTSGVGINRIDAVFNPQGTESTELGERIDLQYAFQSSWLTSLRAGVQNRDFEVSNLRYSRTTRLNCPTAPGVNSGGFVVVVPVPCATIEGIVNDNSTVNPIEFFPTGDLGYSGGVRFWNDNTLDTYYATLAAVGANDDVFAVNPNTNTAQTFGGPGSYQDFLNTWSVEESTLGAYVQAEFDFADFIVPTSGTIGVRYVDTETLSSGFNRTPIIPPPVTGAVNFTPTSANGGYEKYLPSLNLRFEFVPDMLIGRFTASKVLSRSPPSSLALRQSLDIAGHTGSRGNPNLQPFQATQYDAGLEWYFSEDGFISANFFRKEISSFIVNKLLDDLVFIPGDLVGYAITQAQNPDQEVTINGVEVGFQYALDFLPAPLDGFGVLANYTRQESEGFFAINALTPQTPDAPLGGAYPFPGLSETAYNFSIYYENDVFSGRFSYNWRDEWLITPTGRGNLPEHNEAFGSLDFSGSLQLVPRLSLFFDAVNLTDEVRIENNTPIRRIGNETFGRRYFFGVRARS